MKHSSPIFRAVLLATIASSWAAMAGGQSPASVPAAADAGNRLVEEAVRRIEQYSSISARIRFRAELFDQRIVGNGEYRQAASDSRRVRWDTKIQVGERIVSMQQVADGSFLWMARQMGEDLKLTRVELARVLAADKAKTDAGGAPPISRPFGLTPVGGLPKMVRNLERSFRFASPSDSKWGEVPVYVLQGIWKPATLAKVVPDQAEDLNAGRPVDWRHVPEQVPDRVVVILGRDDLFPYRIEYRRADDETVKVLMVVEIYDVQCNIPLEPSLFVYRSGNTPVADITDPFIANLLGP